MVRYYLCQMDEPVAGVRTTHIETVLQTLPTRGWAVCNTSPRQAPNGIVIVIVRGTAVQHAALVAEPSILELPDFLTDDEQNMDEVRANLNAFSMAQISTEDRTILSVRLNAINSDVSMDGTADDFLKQLGRLVSCDNSLEYSRMGFRIK